MMVLGELQGGKQESLKRSILENKYILEHESINTEQDKKQDNNVTITIPENEGLHVDSRLISGKKELLNNDNKSEDRYNDEIAQISPLKRSYGCDQCDFKSLERSEMVHHKDIHHEYELFTCTQCDYWAHYQSHLQDHRGIKHNNINHNCVQCDYQATCQSDLEHHHMFFHKQVYEVEDQITKEPEEEKNMD